MPVKLLTARFVESLKGNGVERVDYRDEKESGLELRVAPSGRKSWSLLYRTEKGRGAQRRRLALGEFPSIDLEKARDLARIRKGEVAQGGDPAASVRRASERVTVADMAGAYLEKHGMRNKRSWRADKAMLDNDVLPMIGKLRPEEVTRAHIVKITDRVIERNAPVQANRVFEVTRGLFRWSVGVYLGTSPFYGLRKPFKERPRDRVLTRDELRTVWTRIEAGNGKERMSEPVQIACRLLMMLGQRAGEVTGATRAELDLDAGSWVIPGERTKNGKAHRVPLSPAVVDLFRRAVGLGDASREARQKRYGSEEPTAYVFPAPFARGGGGWGKKPIGKTAVNHALKKALKGSGVADVTPHDFRRTMSTMMAELGEDEVHIGAVLNHVRAGVTGKHYNLYRYEAEKREALERWQTWLAGTVT